MTSTPRTASTSDARKRNTEEVASVDHFATAEAFIERGDYERASVHASLAATAQNREFAAQQREMAELGKGMMDQSQRQFEAIIQSGDDATPPPAPREPWHVISTDRDKPTLAKVTFGSDYATTAEVFVECGYVWRVMDATAPQGVGSSRIGTTAMLTDVELLHTYNPVTHVPVERALIEQILRSGGQAGLRTLAALADGAEKGEES